MVFPIPKKILSDQGSQYSARIIDDLFTLIGIDRRYTLPHDPKANGLVERVNGEVMRHLRAIVIAKGDKQNWSKYLPMVQRIINSSVHSALGTSPARVSSLSRSRAKCTYDEIK